jgi:hypothetical protein
VLGLALPGLVLSVCETMFPTPISIQISLSTAERVGENELIRVCLCRDLWLGLYVSVNVCLIELGKMSSSGFVFVVIFGLVYMSVSVSMYVLSS